MLVDDDEGGDGGKNLEDKQNPEVKHSQSDTFRGSPSK